MQGLVGVSLDTARAAMMVVRPDLSMLKRTQWLFEEADETTTQHVKTMARRNVTTKEVTAGVFIFVRKRKKKETKITEIDVTNRFVVLKLGEKNQKDKKHFEAIHHNHNDLQSFLSLGNAR